jgi:hypothetical protein
MAGPADTSGGPIRPLVALGLATVTFIALLIFALGMVSLVLGADIVAVQGLGQLPGVFATVMTTAVFALVLWLVLRTARPRYRGALTAAVACYLAYVIAIWLGVLVASGQLSVAGEVAGRIATTWFGLVIALAAGLSAAGGIALVRTRSDRPRWPWEDEFDE